MIRGIICSAISLRIGVLFVVGRATQIRRTEQPKDQPYPQDAQNDRTQLQMAFPSTEMPPFRTPNIIKSIRESGLLGY